MEEKNLVKSANRLLMNIVCAASIRNKNTFPAGTFLHRNGLSDVFFSHPRFLFAVSSFSSTAQSWLILIGRLVYLVDAGVANERKLN